MPRTVYVVKTRTGYLVVIDGVTQTTILKSEAFKTPVLDIAEELAEKFRGQVETLTLDSPSHGS